MILDIFERTEFSKLKQRADGGDSDAQVKVGNYYLKKRNDIKNARYYFEMAVENKNPEGQLELGKCMNMDKLV